MDIAMAYERSTKKCTLELDDDGDINNNRSYGASDYTFIERATPRVKRHC
jgi:hypothetical protein